jgi:hypothetical protein
MWRSNCHCRSRYTAQSFGLQVMSWRVVCSPGQQSYVGRQYQTRTGYTRRLGCLMVPAGTSTSTQVGTRVQGKGTYIDRVDSWEFRGPILRVDKACPSFRRILDPKSLRSQQHASSRSSLLSIFLLISTKIKPNQVLFDVIVTVSECSRGPSLRSHSRLLCILQPTDIVAGTFHVMRPIHVVMNRNLVAFLTTRGGRKSRMYNASWLGTKQQRRCKSYEPCTVRRPQLVNTTEAIFKLRTALEDRNLLCKLVVTFVRVSSLYQINWN